jgi:putative membrane protein
MILVSDTLFGLVALLHFGFLALEMFLWEKPFGLKTFRQTREQAAVTAVLAKNQGLYNGFLAAGIVAALMAGHGAEGVHARLFFGTCVIIAGIYGAVSTGKRSILMMQAAPAALALGTLLLSR